MSTGMETRPAITAEDAAAVRRVLLIAAAGRMVIDNVDELDGYEGRHLDVPYDQDYDALPIERLIMRLDEAASDVAREVGQPSPLSGLWIEAAGPFVVVVGEQPLSAGPEGPRRLSSWAVTADPRDFDATAEGMKAWAALVVETVGEAFKDIDRRQGKGERA